MPAEILHMTIQQSKDCEADVGFSYSDQCRAIASDNSTVKKQWNAYKGPLKLITAVFCSSVFCSVNLYFIATVSALSVVGSPLSRQPACLPVRQLPIAAPWRPSILALHKFLMSMLKWPATSTHWWFNLLRQTNTTAYTCFLTFLAALTLHMHYSEGQARRCWKANGCCCWQLQGCSFLSRRW